MTAQDGGESMEEFSYIVLDLEWNQPGAGDHHPALPLRFGDHRNRGAEAEQPI